MHVTCFHVFVCACVLPLSVSFSATISRTHRFSAVVVNFIIALSWWLSSSIYINMSCLMVWGGSSVNQTWARIAPFFLSRHLLLLLAKIRFASANIFFALKPGKSVTNPHSRVAENPTKLTCCSCCTSFLDLNLNETWWQRLKRKTKFFLADFSPIEPTTRLLILSLYERTQLLTIQWVFFLMFSHLMVVFHSSFGFSIFFYLRSFFILRFSLSFERGHSTRTFQ